MQPRPFPESAAAGPVTRRLVRRTLLGYAGLSGAGFALAESASSFWAKAFGLGLMIPGGGFLLGLADTPAQFIVHGFAAALAFGGFVFALLVWFATGNVLAPVFYWLLAAAAAAALPRETVWDGAARGMLGLILLAAAAAALARWELVRRGGARRAAGNRMLADLIETPWTVKDDELGEDDLALARVLLDRALQPLDRFDGFDVIDQFQTAALRYQVNFAGYALSMLQHVHAPAFQSYLTEAQRNLILKQCDHRIWRYWALENLWGNLDRNADPMGRDNIMFTGFVGTQIALFEAASGDSSFCTPGSLGFRHPNGRVFPHDLPGLVRTLEANMAASPLTLTACEPNWVFPLCNAIGAAAIRFHDPRRFDNLAPEFAAAIDKEFLSASGRLLPCRSSYTGFAIPPVGGAVVQTLPCLFLNATLPDLAARQWHVERPDMLRDGALRRSRFWPVDVGNYRMSRASSYAATAAVAVELGDNDLATMLLDALDRECPSVLLSGVRHRPRASLWAHGAEVLARCGRRDAFSEMIAAGHGKAPEGPHVKAASYPQVLPARARSVGGALDCVFYPGAKPGPASIVVAGLRPQTTYRWQQGKVTSDGEGCANLTFDINRRTEVTLVPHS